MRISFSLGEYLFSLKDAETQQHDFFSAHPVNFRPANSEAPF